MLGEFEYLLISAAMRCGENAYGAAIREHIGQTTKRSCSIGALYTTIDRLESNGSGHSEGYPRSVQFLSNG